MSLPHSSRPRHYPAAMKSSRVHPQLPRSRDIVFTLSHLLFKTFLEALEAMRRPSSAPCC